LLEGKYALGRNKMFNKLQKCPESGKRKRKLARGRAKEEELGAGNIQMELVRRSKSMTHPRYKHILMKLKWKSPTAAHKHTRFLAHRWWPKARGVGMEVGVALALPTARCLAFWARKMY